MMQMTLWGTAKPPAQRQKPDDAAQRQTTHAGPPDALFPGSVEDDESERGRTITTGMTPTGVGRTVPSSPRLSGGGGGADRSEGEAGDSKHTRRAQPGAGGIEGVGTGGAGHPTAQADWG